MTRRVVLITGCSSGIGAEIARLAAQKHNAVILTARREERIIALAYEIHALGGSALAIPGDITDIGHQRRLIEAAVERFGRLHILVNNAAVPLLQNFCEAEPEDLQQQWQTNVTALATLARLALPQLELNQGTIINIGSAISRVAVPQLGNYGPTKVAVAALSRALRRELQPRGVHVCLVEPGPVTGTEFAQRSGMQYDGMSTRACAQAVVDMFEHPRRRVVVPRWLGLPLQCFELVEAVAPWLVDLGFALAYKRGRQSQTHHISAQSSR